MIHYDDQSIISTSGLTKTFGSLVAVNDLQLQVMRGDVFGFLGPNGSGKTTTIRMLLGLIRPTAGRILIFGMDNSSHMPSILPRLGAIVETPVFYPYLSGIDNLRSIAAGSGMRLGKASSRRIDEVLDIVDLHTQANDAYRKYSLGMKQRLGIGAALLTDPELVLLDEPTNGLDPAGVHEIRLLIQRLASLGKTIFVSSHVLYEIQQVCNRVAILQKGRLLKQGNVKDLLSQGEQIVVRLNTPDETQAALLALQQAEGGGAAWLRHIDIEIGEQNRPTLRIDAPVARSSEITALLAQRNLFIAEMHPYQASLEEVFLELTSASTEGTHRGMAALAGSSASNGTIVKQ